MQGEPSEVKLATEDQEHTSHTKTKHYTKTRTNILNYKAPQNTNQEQIFEKRNMRSKIDLIDKWRKNKRGFLHAMIMKVPPKTHRIPNFKIIIPVKNFSPTMFKYPTKVSMF
jgi:hypothetical protein